MPAAVRPVAHPVAASRPSPTATCPRPGSPGSASPGPPSPRGTPRPANTGSTCSRPSSACQRSSATWRPHQRRCARRAAGRAEGWGRRTGRGRLTCRAECPITGRFTGDVACRRPRADPPGAGARGDAPQAARCNHCAHVREPAATERSSPIPDRGRFAHAHPDRSCHVTDLDQLVDGRLADPHSVLGAHRRNGGVVVRAFRPAADAVTSGPLDAAARGGRTRAGPPGRRLRGRPPRGRRCRCATSSRSTTRDGDTFTLGDPYRFLPTLGEIDLHLAGEGRHEELYERARRARARARGRRAARRSPCGRRPRAPSPSWATSTPGTAGCTRCARSARAASGSCSCPTSAGAPGTSTRSSRPTASSG